MVAARGCLHRLIRRKVVDFSTSSNQLERCLSALDLIALGIGCTLGAGIYVVAGQVARQVAGPSVVLSFLVAAVASMFAGLCYAEFGARVPKAGSAYIYSYVTLGELCAFIIGWNLVLEYIIGTASVARAWTSYFDSLLNNVISDYFLEHSPMTVPSLAAYPDFMALGLVLLLTCVLLLGAREPTLLNTIFTIVNLFVVAYIFVSGLFKVDINNWNISEAEIGNSTSTDGSGGFFPFGVSGMLSGAATCFYAFIGFDVIATTGEEAKNPQRDIPLGIIVSLSVCALAYCGISGVLTLMIPYNHIDIGASLPDAFQQVGWGVAHYIITVGAVCGLSTSLLGAMFPMPRVTYSMASDGLLFKGLAYVSPRFKTPVVSTICTGSVAGVMAMLLDIKELVDLMSITTLSAYTLVAACVIILRYDVPYLTDHNTNAEIVGSDDVREVFCCSSVLHSTSNTPTNCSAMTVKVCIFLYGFFCVIVAAFQRQASGEITEGRWWAVTVLALCGLCMFVLIIIIAKQPQSSEKMAFKVPLLPWVPAISMFINVYLMLQLSSTTWLQFAIWIVLGLIIYFTYGMWHSKEETDSNIYEQIPGDDFEKAPLVPDAASFAKEEYFDE